MKAPLSLLIVTLTTSSLAASLWSPKKFAKKSLYRSGSSM